MSAMCDIDLSTFCGRIGRIYGRYGLCPPFALHDAARAWMATGVPLSHCVEVIERYLSRHAGSCYSGSGDWNFAWLNSLIHASWHERSFARPPRPTPQQASHCEWLDEHGAGEASRPAGPTIRYSAQPPELNPRSAGGALSRATRPKSTFADQISSLARSGSRSPGNDYVPNPKKIDTAVAWLRTELASGERMSTVVEAKARSVGIAPRTFDRARERLGIKSRRVGFGRSAKYIMILPVCHATPNALSSDAGAT